ncbi:unnamed protein product [Zymoseptoria tritici ST99CH_1A5]|uniref:Uncharacterized protein n=2 Tax=Zymoseptoria tritici TaxID=1047171 RepID=A0A1X7S9L6_ZYMT9|nr:unnamed protein product [Zymoseptoria tritici ST99CH_3D7]SMR64825.1 unnamed protein product [Zymoseptoria tritici ST99CH_3D1]SMY30221.1 unnamed protein product [Zymoseptoria tritici ST99CH_1A5]
MIKEHHDSIADLVDVVIMSSTLKKAVKEIFEEISKTKSNLKRVLNMSESGAGQRVFPPRTSKNDEKFGLRLDKGEPVQGKPGFIRLNLQANSNAKNNTIREMAQKDSHRVLASIDIDTKQEANKENASKLRDQLIGKL